MIGHLENMMAYVFCASIVGIVTAQVVFRFVLSKPLSWSQEAATFLLIWMVLLGMAIAQREGANISIRLLTQYFKKYDRLLKWIPWVSMLLFFAVIGLGGLEIALTHTGDKSPAAGIPLWVVFMGFPVASLLGCWHLMMELLSSISSRKDEANDLNPFRPVHRTAAAGESDHGGHGNRNLGVIRHE